MTVKSEFVRRFTRFNQVLGTDPSNTLLAELATRHILHIREILRGQETSNEDFWSYAAACCEELSGALCKGEYAVLALYEVDLNRFGACSEATRVSAADLLYHIQQIIAFYKKRVDLDVGINRSETALATFIESERLCLETNELLKARSRGLIQYPTRVESVIRRAQWKVSRILGSNIPDLADLRIRFGKGATTRTPKRIASARRKLREGLVCGEGFLSAASAAIRELPGWYSSKFKDDDEDSSVLLTVYVDDGRLEFVPKNCKTDRAITPSPNLDIMFQLGIGEYITRRLAKFGVDLADQGINRCLAQQGSLTGDLATLDLSSASDTVSIELVYNLLPVDWANFLWSYRTPTVRHDGKVLKLQKFSSMGNGFTFPLETLIFYTLAKAVVDEVGTSLRTVSVYGDDIIIPSECVPLMEDVLRCTGFLLNKQKSFYTGHFRESCGGDYLWGTDVRPCYVKDRLHCSDVFRLHNFYVRRGLEEWASVLREVLDPRVELFGPDGFGDGHLLGDFILKPVGRNKGWAIGSFQTYTRQPSWDFLDDTPDVAGYPAYHVYANPAKPGLPDLECPVEQRNWQYGRRAAFHNVALSSTRYAGELLGTIVPGNGRYQKTKVHTFG